MRLSAQTAKAIKQLLRRRFPGTKFSVTSIGGLATWIQVEWTDGPSHNQVRELTASYDDEDNREQPDGVTLGSQHVTLRHKHSDLTFCKHTNCPQAA